MTQTEIQERYATDQVCVPCKGTGRRGRGRCSKCNGKGVADLKHPRIQFNWGYHDARHDARHDRIRDIVSEGPQTLSQVSIEASFWYAYGYQYGITGTSTSSQPSWLTFTGLNPES